MADLARNDQISGFCKALAICRADDDPPRGSAYTTACTSL
jgi:hypothetical protein